MNIKGWAGLAALLFLLGGCTAMANAWVSGVVEQVKTGADGTASTVGSAQCLITLGAFYRLPDPRHAAGATLLCDPDAVLPVSDPMRLTFEQWQAITADVPAPGSR